MHLNKNVVDKTIIKPFKNVITLKMLNAGDGTSISVPILILDVSLLGVTYFSEGG